MRIAVVGLGHLGALSAACFAKLGHEVIGIDRDNTKVAALARGDSPIDEVAMPELIGAAYRRGRISSSDQLSASTISCDLILICVDTPAVENSLDLKNLLDVCGKLRELAREAKRFPLVVIRSTLPPGTWKNNLAQFAASSSKLRFVYNPEFSREGNAVADFMAPGRIVIGVHYRRDALKVRELYRGIKAPIHVTDWTNAEMLKCVENSFHALKVAFANEIGALSESFGADGAEVMALLCTDTRLNISPAYLRPGLPFGGPCLHKDLGALIGSGHRSETAVPLLRAILESNNQHFERVVRNIKGKRSRVSFEGLSHKRGVKDTRGSHLLELATRLKAEGISVTIADQRNGATPRPGNHVATSARNGKPKSRNSEIVFAAGSFEKNQLA